MEKPEPESAAMPSSPQTPPALPKVPSSKSAAKKAGAAATGSKPQQSSSSTSSSANAVAEAAKATSNSSGTSNSNGNGTDKTPTTGEGSASGAKSSASGTKSSVSGAKSSASGAKSSASGPKSSPGSSSSQLSGAEGPAPGGAGGCGDSKADTEEGEEDSGTPCECVQCEVCMAENWWRMAAFHNQLLQQQGGDSNSSPTFEISESAATGLDLIGSAATLMLSQQQAADANGGVLPAGDDMLRADFSMPKLRQFFECQKQMGIPNFPEDFDEFWLLVVKARLFNIFKYRGPEAYNRIVLKIRNIARQFREQMEERERQEAAASALAEIVAGKVPKELAQKLEQEEKKQSAEEKPAMAKGKGAKAGGQAQQQ